MKWEKHFKEVKKKIKYVFLFHNLGCFRHIVSVSAQRKDFDNGTVLKMAPWAVYFLNLGAD